MRQTHLAHVHWLLSSFWVHIEYLQINTVQQYNFTAGSYTQRNFSRLYSIEIEFYSKN